MNFGSQDVKLTCFCSQEGKLTNIFAPKERSYACVLALKGGLKHMFSSQGNILVHFSSNMALKCMFCLLSLRIWCFPSACFGSQATTLWFPRGHFSMFLQHLGHEWDTAHTTSWQFTRDTIEIWCDHTGLVKWSPLWNQTTINQSYSSSLPHCCDCSPAALWALNRWTSLVRCSSLRRVSILAGIPGATARKTTTCCPSDLSAW